MPVSTRTIYIQKTISYSEPTEPKQTPSKLAQAIAEAPSRHTNERPLWAGPSGIGLLGGVTQSMLARFISCRERFRLRYMLGLEPHDKWNKTIGYGDMWHVCEESHAAGVNSQTGDWKVKLDLHINEQFNKFPLQREEIEKWYRVCMVQFPEYIKYWSEHPDVKNRTPIMQEQVFDVPYELPSGRVVRLRGKFDSVDLITDEITGPNGGIYNQENKTKGDIDEIQVERQLKFDLQTMMYTVALYQYAKMYGAKHGTFDDWVHKLTHPICGVRYNVVRRPLSGGKGSIKPHAAKATKTKITPAETADEFYERLRRDYIADDPKYWFFRVRSEISAQDVEVFKKTCLNPLLEQLCWWYDETIGRDPHVVAHDYGFPQFNYRTPFGVWSALEENGSTEYDAYLATGSETGLSRADTLFKELQ